jgi:molecular chaperone GrpE
MPNSNRPNEAAETDGEVTMAPPSAEIEQLLEQMRNEHELYLRALADFDNYRKRVERDNESGARSGKREIILSLLDVLDSFDLALGHMSSAPQSVFDGVQAIYRKLQRLLEVQGVTPFDSRGQPFDPALHEAIASVDTDAYARGIVVDQVQRGYRWDGELLRPARVRVAR